MVQHLAPVFDRIYRRNEWTGGPSRSGQGAGDTERAELVPELRALVADLRIQSVLDIGCGEGYWMPKLPGYIGLDVSAEALQVARARHPKWDYRLDDGSPFPATDAAIVRCVIQHLSFASAQALLERVRDARIKWLICTTYERGFNEDIEDGRGYWPNMRLPPFSLDEPVRSLRDGRTDNEDRGARLAVWRLTYG